MRIWTILPFLGSIAVSACTGSPVTLATPPDFELETPAGIASVSIRESPPGTTDAGFERLVASGMESEMPGSLVKGPMVAPFPTRRIVWHANPTAAPGVSVLIVNVFDGSYPFAYQQQVVANDAPPGVLVSAIASMTSRLAVDLHQSNPGAPAQL
jgi:hypothetical protein